MFPVGNTSLETRDEEVIALNALGLNNSAIAEHLGVNRHAVGEILRANGLRSRRKSNKIKDRGDGLVECSKCARILPRTDLPWGRVTTRPYQLSYCRKCLTVAQVENTAKSIPQYLKHRSRVLKGRALESGIPFDLAPGYLADLWEQQEGLCFYTDAPMQVYFGTGRSGSRRDSLSVDKLVPNLGYVAGNVVLCCSRINTIKQDCTLSEMAEWMPGWHKRITDYLAAGLEEGIPVTWVPGWEYE